MSDNDVRRERIRAAWETVWGGGDVAALDGFFSPDYRRYGNSGVGHDAQAFGESIRSTREAFPDLVTTIEDLVIEGDVAAIRWRSNGTHRHPFLGVPATNKRVEISGATFAHFDGDLVTAEYVTWDPSALLTALGIITVGQGD